MTSFFSFVSTIYADAEEQPANEVDSEVVEEANSKVDVEEVDLKVDEKAVAEEEEPEPEDVRVFNANHSKI